MAKVEGRRDDETATPSSQKRGPEKVTLIVVVVLAVIGVVGLLVLAGG
jgi:flagellar basal body-associated protein FliL